MLKSLVQSQFVRNVAKLVLGTGLAQVITFVAAPVIARLYGPESFGQQSALLALVNPIMILASLAFPVAIVVAHSEREALVLERLALWGSLLISPFVLLVFLWHDGWLLRLLGLGDLGPYAPLVPLLVMLTTMNTSSGYALTRYKAFGLSARAAIAAALIGNAIKVVFGFIHPSTLTLIVGTAIGWMVTPILAARMRRRLVPAGGGIGIAELKAAARAHRDFPLLRAPQIFIYTLSQALPVVSLTASFGAAAAGHYAFALAMTVAPITLIGNAVQSVLYPKLTETARAGKDTTAPLLRATGGLLVLGIPAFVPIMLFGPALFTLLLGADWRDSGVFAALLSPWLWLGLANRPAVSLIPALGLQGGLLIYEVFSTVAKVIAIVIGAQYLKDPVWTVALFSAAGSAAYIGLIVWVILASRRRKTGADHGKTS